MTTTPNPGPTPGRFRIDSRISAAALRAPAASKEDSCPQAILKFQPLNSFDYRVRYEPQLYYILINLSVAITIYNCKVYNRKYGSSQSLITAFTIKNLYIYQQKILNLTFFSYISDLVQLLTLFSTPILLWQIQHCQKLY